jgi:hypothetical protein
VRYFAAVPRSAARLHILIVLSVLLLSLAGYGALLRLDSVPYSRHSDVVAYLLASKQVLHRSLEQGFGIPYWRSDQLSGTPAFTNPNALFTNPLHLAFLVGAPARVVGLTFFLQLLAAACGCYLTGRALGLGLWPRVFMAVAGLFGFKLILAVYAGWLVPLAGISVVPFVFASAFWLARSPGLGPALALAASGILCLHSGHLQIPFYAGGFAGVYLLGAALATWRRGQRAQAGWLSLWVLAAALLAVASTLYLLWPMAGEASLVSRSQASSEFLQAGHRLGARHLLTLLWPEALGTPLDGNYQGTEIWEDNAYFGLLPLVLAVAGAWLAWRRPTTSFLALGFLLSLLFALDTPLLRLLYSLPGFALFRSPARILFLTAFLGTALAGVGLEAVLAWLRSRVPRLGVLVPVTLVLIVASEGVLYAHRYIDTKPLSFFQPVTQSSRLLAEDPSLFRVAPLGRFTLLYGSAASQGLQLIAGYEPYNLRRYQRYMDLLQFGQIRRDDAVVWTDLVQVTRWDLLDDLNVKYLLSSRPLPLPAGHFDLLAGFQHEPIFVFYRGMRETDVFVYRNRQVRPRVYFARQLLIVPDLSSAQAELAKPAPEAPTIVESRDSPEPFVPSSADDRLSVVRAGDGFLDISYECGHGRFVVLSEIGHPGWRATVDGQALPLYPTNVSLMGAWLPAGRHRLALAFRPLHFSAALGVSLCSLGVFAATLALYGWRRRRSRPHAGTEIPSAEA